MILTYFVPIFGWGPYPNNVHENISGCEMYSDLQSLYAFAPEAVGHFKVSGKIPTKEEFMKNDDYYDKCDDSPRNKRIDPTLELYATEDLKKELERRKKIEVEMKICKLQLQIEELKKEL